MLSVVVAHLLVVSSAHEDDLVCKIGRRGIPPRREELLDTSSLVHGCVRWIDVPNECEWLSRNPICAREVTMFKKLICSMLMFKHFLGTQF